MGDGGWCGGGHREAERPWGFTKRGKRGKESLGAARGLRWIWEMWGGGVARGWEAERPWGFTNGGEKGDKEGREAARG